MVAWDSSVQESPEDENLISKQDLGIHSAAHSSGEAFHTKTTSISFSVPTLISNTLHFPYFFFLLLFMTFQSLEEENFKIIAKAIQIISSKKRSTNEVITFTGFSLSQICI